MSGGVGARPSGLLWITGCPGSGKTTVGDAVHALAVEAGIFNSVRLDGDALRQFLQLTTVESEEDRITLGMSYIGFAEHLARQGQLVILTAVAMYDEVFAAFGDVDVPKVVVRLIEGGTPTTPPGPLVDIPNPMDGDPRGVAATVMELCERQGLLASRLQPTAATQEDIARYARRARTRRRHWDTFYRHNEAPENPSSFARTVSAHPMVSALPDASVVVDFGCGNGRDSRFFAGRFPVVGLDSSASAIEAAASASMQAPQARLRFTQTRLLDLKAQLADLDPSLVYCRFVLHALSPDEEGQFLDAVAHGCRPGTLLAVEARTVADPMAGRGSKVSANERVFGHYRRFLDPDVFLESLMSRAFTIVESSQSCGVAALGKDDPDVLRVLARK